MRPGPVLTLDDLATALHATGAAVWDAPLSPDLSEAIRAEVLTLWAADRFVAATIGRAKLRRPDIRTDAMCWLQPTIGADGVDAFADQAGLFALRALLEQIREVMSQRAFVHLDDTEMFASHYPVGGFYAPHVDRFVGTGSRFFTFVYFLNPGWKAADGGELQLMGEGGQTISPMLGRLVLFYTPKLLHQVLVTQVGRFAVTGWLGKRGVA